jgi:hypothetical protein
VARRLHGITSEPSKFKPDIAPVDPSELAKFFSESDKTGLSFLIALRNREQNAEPPHLMWLLCVRADRPNSCCPSL